MRVKLPIRLSAHVWRCPGSTNNEADSHRGGSPRLRDLPELPLPSNVTSRLSKAALYDMAHGRDPTARRSGAIISQSASYTKVNICSAEMLTTPHAMGCFLIPPVTIDRQRPRVYMQITMISMVILDGSFISRAGGRLI